MWISLQKSDWITISIHFLRFPFSNHGMFQNVHEKLYRNQWKKFSAFSSPLESFWNVFEVKHSYFFFSETICIASFHVFKQFETHNTWNFSEIVHKLYEKLLKVEKLGFSQWLFEWFFCATNTLYIYLSTKVVYWTTNSFIVELFYHSKTRCLSNIWRKLPKNVKCKELTKFLSISVTVQGMFQIETVFITFKKILGQRFFSLGNVFQYQPQSLLKKKTESVNKEIFGNLRKLVQFFWKYGSFQKGLLDNEFFLCWTFLQF